jgi:DNA-binding response OmpR family regulator/tRNA A-37 threonylcarbamoyl transferase component Bud32
MTLQAIIVDDSEDFRLLIRQYLALEWADAQITEWDPLTRGEIDDNFDLQKYDVLMLDYVLGNADGLDWLKRLKRRADCPPVIFLTGAGSERVAVQALKSGAFDYLRKHDLSKARLVEAVRNAMDERKLSEITQRMSRTAAISDLTKTAAVARLPDSDAPDAQVVEINGYKVIRKIGSGGMSSVYLVERLSDHQQVVLKILDSKLCEDNEFLMRFIQEFGLIAKIESRHIVKIYDQGFTDRHVYIAMEYFANGDLRARIKKGVQPAEAVGLLKQVTLALKAIHEFGIVHRDLKPENIMFRADDSLAIVDFGIAKMISDVNSLTQTGHILGTPYYLSPEQAQGDALDGRSDMYSAGVMMFEMLTQRRPFTAATPIALVNKHIHDPVPRLPAGLERFQDLIDRLMAKSPRTRFANAQQLLEYLDKLSV